jgi:hypothetical protein
VGLPWIKSSPNWELPAAVHAREPMDCRGRSCRRQRTSPAGRGAEAGCFRAVGRPFSRTDFIEGIPQVNIAIAPNDFRHGSAPASLKRSRLRSYHLRAASPNHQNRLHWKSKIMTDLQLYLAIGLPIVANASMFLVFQQSIHRQFDALIQRLDRIEKKFDGHETRITRVRTLPIGRRT